MAVALHTCPVALAQCFAPGVDYPVGLERAVTGADFNGDGRLDLATPSKLLTGNGAGGFAITSISTLNGAGAVINADFNNDGRKDLAVVDVYRLFILLGNGAGGFSAPTTFYTGGSILQNIVSADFNGDGKADIAAIADTELKVLLGNGLGGFSVATVATLTGNPVFTDVATADFNRDGRMDLVAIKTVGFGTSIGYLTVFLGNGAGGFSALTDQMIGAYPRSVTVADLNNDGKMDVAIFSDNSVSIALGTGSGSFTVNTTYGAGGSFITTCDFNGDGNKDLVKVSGGTSIEPGNGTGSYSSNYPVSPKGGPDVVCADFNSDGKTDLAIANTADGAVTVLLGRIAIATTQTNVSTCFGGTNGTATATGSCGTSYTYSWNTNPRQTSATATGLAAGTYTVTVSQGLASSTATVSITQPQDISIATTSVNERCDGGGRNGTATGTVAGGTAPYTYSWNTSPVQTNQTASNLTAGNYVLTVNDANGCVKRANVRVNYTPNPTSFAYTTNGMVVSFARNGVGCNTFVWDFGNGNTSTINPNPTVTYLAPGTYGVCLQCNGQPVDCIKCLNITVPSNTSGGTLAATQEAQKRVGITIYPNPTQGFVTIENKEFKHGATYAVLNSIGQTVLTGQLIGTTTVVNIGGLTSGIYLLQAGQTDKKSFKLMVE